MFLLWSSPNRIEYPNRIPACIEGSSSLLRLLEHILVVQEEGVLEVPNAGRE
ncbi:hypothetical protein OG763_03405 [Streptomyces sp. NBC_01230]|uniref:hypothetical protein n=1 Tax=Streptomyces sp. NBC_01230 TaxID=2903784 RepID=UPI002E0F16B6|nr:hypothetical protein OG763_03405 [Streptomyces sp. NBC_01230]